MEILEISNDIEKKNITRYILEALPDWFGIPEAREEYIEDSVGKIFFCAYKDEKPVLSQNPGTIRVALFRLIEEGLIT